MLGGKKSARTIVRHDRLPTGYRPMNTLNLRLPRLVESDPRGPELLRTLASRTRPLWREGEIGVPVIPMGTGLSAALLSARSAGRMVRGLENAERVLAAEERGLRHISPEKPPDRPPRISRLLVLTSDGSERFYRRVEKLLLLHGPRLLAVRLDVNAADLGGLLFGPGGLARLLMLNHKEAVSAALLAIAPEASV